MSAGNDHIEIIKYLRGEMSHEEAHAFERKALDDPFLADALEGAESIGVDQFEKDLIALNNKISPSKPTTFNFLKIAAVISLLILGGFSIWYITDDLKTSDVAYTESESEEIKPEKKPEPESTDEHEESTSVEIQESAFEDEERPVPTEDPKPVAQIEIQDLENIPLEEEVLEEVVFEESEADTFGEIEADDFADAAPAEEAQREAAQPPAQSALKKARRSKLTTTGAVSRSTEQKRETRELRGLITDDFGDQLPGVNVVIQGTSNGVTTDLDGQFSISPVDDSTRLVFSSIGMKTQEIVVGRRDSMNVKMLMDTESLQEVVVTGYGAFDNEPEGYFGTSPVIGFAEFKEYLEKELIYPQEAKDKGIEGRVVLKVTISPTGKIDTVEVKRSLGSGCDEEAIRLIEEGPAWSPATQDGINVEATVRIRVKFELE